MRDRTSKSYIAPGEWSQDQKGETEYPEMHYMLSSDWGNLYIRVDNKKLYWFHNFNKAPNWIEVAKWLLQIEQELYNEYYVFTKGMAKKALLHLRLNWRKD